MNATEEILHLLAERPMVAVGLATLNQYQYEMLMLKVRAELMRQAHKEKGPQRDDL